jgi:metal-sulfur cluster biosynthetic enzyme
MTVFVLWVNGQLLINQWKHQATTEYSGSIDLQAGQKYDIRVEYFDGTGDANIDLSWSSPSTSKQIIPQSRLSHVPAPAPMVGSGDGLAVTYYDNKDFTGRTGSRVDASLNLNWRNQPPLSGFGEDFWSARWTGQVQAQYSQTYTFHARANDGVRLWVNGQLLINQWKEQGTTEYSGSIALQAGQRYDIKLEYFDATGDANIDLAWDTPITHKQMIPQSQLYSR